MQDVIAEDAEDCRGERGERRTSWVGQVSRRSLRVFSANSAINGYFLLYWLQLGAQLVHGGHVVEAGEVGVAGQGLALLAVYQDLHF
jgi:hypothetical protein